MQLTRQISQQNGVPSNAIYAYYLTPLQNRTQEQLERCHDELRKLTFFAELEKEMTKNQIIQLIKELTLEKHPSKYELFGIGDSGKKFYIIIHGSVLILIPQDARIKENENSLKLAKKLKSDNQRLLAQYLINQDEELVNQTQVHKDLPKDDKQYKVRASQDLGMLSSHFGALFKEISSQYKGFTVYSELMIGESFGEIAIRTQGLRTTSAVCFNDTYLLALNNVAYQKVLKSYHDQLYNDKIKFLKNINLLKNWTLGSLHQMLYYLKTYKGQRGEVIYKVNDPSKYLYFIKQGEVEIVQPIDIVNESKKLTQFQQQVNQMKRSINKLRVGRTVHQGLCILGESDHFGEDEIFKKTCRKSSAFVYSSTSEIYYISTKKFFKNLASFVLIDQMILTHEQKTDWHDQMIKKTNIIQSNLGQQIKEQFSQNDDRHFVRREQSQSILSVRENQNYDTFKKMKIYLSKNTKIQQADPADMQAQLSGPQRILLSTIDLERIKQIAERQSPPLLNKRKVDIGFLQRACYQNFHGGNHPRVNHESFSSMMKPTKIQTNLSPTATRGQVPTFLTPKSTFLTSKHEEYNSEDIILPFIKNYQSILKLKVAKNLHFVDNLKQGENHRRRNKSEKIMKSLQFVG